MAREQMSERKGRDGAERSGQEVKRGKRKEGAMKAVEKEHNRGTVHCAQSITYLNTP